MLKILQFFWVVGVCLWAIFQQADAIRIVAGTSSTPTVGTVATIREAVRSGPVYATISDLALDCPNAYKFANCRARGVPSRAIPAFGEDRSTFVLVSADSFRGDPCSKGAGFAFTGMAMAVRPQVRDRFGDDFPRNAMEFHPGNTPASYWVEVIGLLAAAVIALVAWFGREREATAEDLAQPVYVPAEKPAPAVRTPQGHLFREERKTLHAWLGLPDPIPSRFDDPSITFRLERACGMLDWATMRHADDYAAWHYRGRVQEALGRYQQALESYRIALLRNPRSNEESAALARETEAAVRTCQSFLPAAPAPGLA